MLGSTAQTACRTTGTMCTPCVFRRNLTENIVKFRFLCHNSLPLISYPISTKNWALKEAHVHGVPHTTCRHHQRAGGGGGPRAGRIHQRGLVGALGENWGSSGKLAGGTADNGGEAGTGPEDCARCRIPPKSQLTRATERKKIPIPPPGSCAGHIDPNSPTRRGEVDPQQPWGPTTSYLAE